MEQAKESMYDNSEMEADVQVEEIDRLSMNSTDPTLLVQVPTNNQQQIQNASRTTMAAFTATVTTLLDAAAAEEDRTGACSATSSGSHGDKKKEGIKKRECERTSWRMGMLYKTAEEEHLCTCMCRNLRIV